MGDGPSVSLPDGPALSEAALLDIFSDNPFPFLRDCYQRYGDLFTLHLGKGGMQDPQLSGQWVFVANAPDLKTLFKADSATVLAGRANQIQFQQLMPANTLVMLDGPLHLERRKLLGKLMQSGKAIRRLSAAMATCVAQEVRQCPVGQVFPLLGPLRRIAMACSSVLIFGDTTSGCIKQFMACLNQLSQPLLGSAQKQACIQACDEICDQLLDTASQAAPDSLLALLHAAGPEGSGQLQRADIKAELLTMMLVGVETTAATMAWCIAHTLANPDVHARVVQELTQVRRASGEAGTCDLASFISSGMLDAMPCLDAVIQEGCRLSPVLMNTAARLLQQPLSLGAHCLPAGTMVVCCMHLIHTRADYYPDPFRFDPERFLGNNPDASHHVSFGGGTRRCLGMGFALYEIKLVMACLFSLGQWDGGQVSVAEQLQRAFILPEGGVPVQFTPTGNGDASLV